LGCYNHIMSHVEEIRPITFESYVTVGYAYFKEVSKFNFLRKRSAASLGIYDRQINYALLNYLGYYQPRLKKFRVSPSVDDEGNIVLYIRIPENQGDYFLNGEGLPEEDPLVIAMRRDIYENLHLGWRRLGNTAMWGSRRKNGSNGKMGVNKNEIFRKVLKEALDKGVDWNEIFLSKAEWDDMDHRERATRKKKHSDADEEF
jgi:hypothetical protein